MKKRLLTLVLTALAVVLPTKLWAQEAYAVLSDDSLTVTFYYDDQKANRSEVVEINNKFLEAGNTSAYGSATQAVFDPSFDNYRPTSTYCWFMKCDKLVYIYGMNYLRTDNVTDMYYMFFGCSSLTSLDMTAYNTANVTNMYGMFYGCSSLTSLDLGSLSTNNVTDMGCMFYGCSGLTTLDLSNFNTENVTKMYYMFEGCPSLTSLKLNSFNTANVTDMRYMFRGCSGLTNLDLSTFNTANVTSMADMFLNCSSLATIYVGSEWTTDNLEGRYGGDGLFTGCTALVGGMGTVYDAAHVNADYAHIDGGADNPGYFTAKDATPAVSYGEFIYFIGSTDGWANAEQKLALTGDNGVYTGFVYCADPNGWGNEFKFQRVAGDWNTEINTGHMTGGITGDFGDGGGNFSATAGEGVYHVTLDMNNLTLNGTKVQTMGIVGDFNGWGGTGDIAMTWNPDDYCFEALGITVSSDGFGWKFRANEAWDIELGTYGEADSPSALDNLGPNGQNILVTATDLRLFPTRRTSDNIYATRSETVEKEPYAVLSDDSLTVTFYYDTQKANRSRVVEINTTWFNSNIETSAYGSATQAVIDPSFADYQPTSTANWFCGCPSLTAISGMEYLNTEAVTNMNSMFYGCYSLENLDVSGFKTDNVTNMASVFYQCWNLESLDVSNFNTANVMDMSDMFVACQRLASLDVSNFNTANVTNMRGMFFACQRLASLDLSGFKTDNVTYMDNMFKYCSSLTRLDVSGFKTDNVTDMDYMFADCPNLIDVNFGDFNTAKVESMSSMFDSCTSLTSLDLSGFDTDNVKNMYAMFRGCSSLTSLDVSGFKTDNVTDMGYMFSGCSSLTTIYAGAEWSTEAVTQSDGMFDGCTSLVGGEGTTYDADHTDHTYARIDREGEPGYFTDKNAPVGLAEFDGRVATVSGNRTLDEAFEQAGGRTEAAKTITAIVWQNATALTDDMLEGITNPNLLIYVAADTLASLTGRNVIVDGTVGEITLTDTGSGNCDFYCPQAFTAGRISYTRNFRQQTQVGVSRGWETLALPFTVQHVTHETKGAIVPFGGSDDYPHFWLRRLSADGLQRAMAVEANVPYIISMPNDRENYPEEACLDGWVTFWSENVTVPVTEQVVTALADSTITMRPALQRRGRSSSVWALNVGEVRGQYLEGSVFERDYREVRPFEAYTVHRGSSSEGDNPNPRFVPIAKLPGGTTGIKAVQLSEGCDSIATTGTWYDLQGRRLQGQPTQKGIYVRNGRKVVVE